MSKNQYFRAGTGTIIYNEKGEILLFSRADRPTVWQLQQGGLDVGEVIEDTLWRELKEETALLSENFISVLEYPTWLSYEYPKDIRQNLTDVNCLGQIHKWYFLLLKPEVLINLSQASDREFIDSKWSTFADLLHNTDTLKKAVYSELSNYFTSDILPRL